MFKGPFSIKTCPKLLPTQIKLNLLDKLVFLFKHISLLGSVPSMSVINHQFLQNSSWISLTFVKAFQYFHVHLSKVTKCSKQKEFLSVVPERPHRKLSDLSLILRKNRCFCIFLRRKTSGQPSLRKWKLKRLKLLCSLQNFLPVD